MNIINDLAIINRGHNFIPYSEEINIFEVIKNTYYFSTTNWLMHKAFEAGYAYGKRAERARRNKIAKQP